jgi:diadenylate cyclase
LIPIGFLEFGFKDLLEVGFIAFILVYLYRWIRGSFAMQATIGLVTIIGLNAFVSAFGFSTINFIISSILDFGVLAVLIIFQPEIRKLLYSLGRNTNLDKFFDTGGSNPVLDEVIEALKTMSKEKIGALIVFAGNSNLQDIINPGVQIQADVSKDLLLTIFNKNTPLHDGAVIIRNNRIERASVYLTLSQNPNISQVFGTRHRAAVGITESSNVLVLVVSEETGRISIAKVGNLNSGLTIQQVRTELQIHFGKAEKDANSILRGNDQMELKFQ